MTDAEIQTRADAVMEQTKRAGHRYPDDDDKSMRLAIEAAIRDAVAAATRQERERCAALIRRFKTENPPGTVSFWGEALADVILGVTPPAPEARP